MIIIQKEKNANDILFEELSSVASSNYPEWMSFDINQLFEMSKLTKRDTGLPVDIWVDEGRTFTRSGHGKRIKIQATKGDPNSRNWLAVTVSPDPDIPRDQKKVKHDLTAKDLNKVKQFIKLNLDSLNRLGNNFSIVDFSKAIKKVT